MMSVKLATLGLLKIKIFWNKGYGVITSVHDVTNKILSCDSSCIIDVVMWTKFGNSSISLREAFITSILEGFGQKNQFFEEWSWFKFNHLELALGVDLKFYTSVAKKLELKVRKF